MIYSTFFFHRKGLDCNGNYGPSPDDPGWEVLVVPTEGPPTVDDAIPYLELRDQLRVQAFVEKERRRQKCSQCGEPTCRSVLHITADFAGWSIPWTLYDQEAWDNELNNMKYNYEAEHGLKE